MPTFILDGYPVALDRADETLGKLLAEVDEAVARNGRIVTALRLDGVDEPAFREPAVTGQRVDRWARIEVESGTEAQLAARCLSEAAVALQALAHSAADTADQFRSGRVGDANSDLVTITHSISTALAIVGAASLGLGVDLGSLSTSEGTLTQLTDDLARQLETLIAAQQSADWFAAADILEQGLAPALRRWQAVCDALDATHQRP